MCEIRFRQSQVALFILMYSLWNKFSSSWQHWRCFVVSAGYGSGDGNAATASDIDDGVVRGGGVLFWLND